MRPIPSMAALLLAVGQVVASPAIAETPEEAAHEARAFIAGNFAVPTLVETPNFTLVPLGPELADIDFAAYMSSIAHLQQTFTRSTGWPNEGITAAEAMTDMQTEQGRFQRRESFAYAVLTPDGTRERGCVYVYPSNIAGYDAEISLWVTKAEYDAGFDAELYAWTKEWIAKDWRFTNAAYPGRAIAWDTWDALTAAAAAS